MAPTSLSRTGGRTETQRGRRRPIPASNRTQSSSAAATPSDLDEALHECERRVGDLAPATVDRQRVAAIRDLLDLGDTRIALLPLVGGVRDRQGDRVVLIAVDDQERAAVGILRVHLRL